MILEIKIPSPGESITEVELGKWLVEDGVMVNKNQEIAEIESDKATLSLTAPASGKIRILIKEGDRISVGSVACTIESDQIDSFSPDNSEKTITEPTITTSVVTPVTRATKYNTEIERPDLVDNESHEKSSSKVKFTPAARAVMHDVGLSVDDVLRGLHRLNQQDIEYLANILKKSSLSQTGKEQKSNEPKLTKDEESGSSGTDSKNITRHEDRTPMSPLRRKLSQRLVAVKNETAMLTTFNEIDMSRLILLRINHQKAFTEKYGFKLGFMSFFTKGVSIALSLYPVINSMMDGDDIITPQYHDIGIAVQTPKGLMVPIIRNAETKNIEELEYEIKEMAEKARIKKLTIAEMTGGTFTITNGGLFGSLMSTPILNPPQSAILGMHAIKERPVAIEGRMEIRPMMYVALSYDHRIIDGQESVHFLVKLKELIEEPSNLLFKGKNPEDLLLGL
jgi:2-oxoglutarate dehydrogenase E2 component (dihydrolipoamide succinyltransferase)